MDRTGAASPSGKSADEGKRSTTGQGEAVGSANLSREQRSKITTIVMQHKVAPARLNVSVEVGTRVPDSAAAGSIRSLSGVARVRIHPGRRRSS
jgi:hypothetical protein